MRIFFLDYGYERGLQADAGGFRKLWELARAVTTHGWDATVFYPRLPGREGITDVPARGYRVVDVPILRPVTAYASMFVSAATMARRARPDVVYFRSGLNVLPPMLRSISGARIVLEINADVQEFLRGEGSGADRRRLFALAERRNAATSDLVVTLTPGLARMVVERYAVAPARVRVIPSGTDCDHFVPADAAAARSSLGIDPAAPVVGFVGLFYRHQGVPVLLEALARLRATHGALKGLIVGDGAMRQSWEAETRRLGLTEIVRFTGQVPYARVPAHLAAMDVVVAPFTADRGETSPFKVLDALACARPVVASDIASVRELATDSGALTLVRPDDPAALAAALGQLLADPERRATLGRRGRAFVLAAHDWRRIADRLVGALGGVTEPVR
jgi:glycosyltransferase involved in cell wall biosynthesis